MARSHPFMLPESGTKETEMERQRDGERQRGMERERQRGMERERERGMERERERERGMEPISNETGSVCTGVVQRHITRCTSDRAEFQ